MSQSSDLPRVLDLGFGEVVDIKYLQKLFGVSRRSALKYLHVLRIEPFYIGKDAYFSLNTFKRILFVLSKPGAPGFVFPGSARKNDPRIRKPGAPQITTVTQEILDKAADPRTIAEMTTLSGRGTNLLSKLMPPQSPRKEKPDGD
jgi:hypothetical protein